MTSIILLRCDFNDELYELTKAAQNSLKADEKILVDNASTKPLWSWADTIIPNKVNVGYPAGVNQGLAKATGDIIAIANNDIIVSQNWEQVAKEIFEEDSNIGTVHFKMIPYSENFNLGYDTWITGKERWCHASFFVIKKEAIPSGGYFEGYDKGGYDDYDFFHRMRDINGWKQAYTNRAAFKHKDSSTYTALDQKDGDRSERDSNNRELYRKRHGEYPDVQFAKLFPDQMNKPWKPFP